MMRTLNRSKLNYKLRKINDYPITLASAPMGFGKTTALHTYLDKQDFQTIKFSMHHQVDELWVWQEIIKLLNLKITELELPYTFPDSRKSLDQFVARLQSCLNQHLYIILDDVVFEMMPKIMKLLSTYSFIFMPYLHFIVITEDSQNISEYKFSNDIFVLTTHDFAFTKDEIMYLCNFENVHLNDEELSTFYEYTNGWVIAIVLLLESYKQTNNAHNRSHLDKIIHQTYFMSTPSIVLEDFAKLSILKQFSLTFATKICQSKETIKKLIALEQEGFFLKAIGKQTYEFIPLFKVYLNKQFLTLFDNNEAIIREISQYCLDEEHPLEAIELLLKINDYQAIFDILNQYSNISFSDISPNLIKKVFKRLPEKYICEYPYIYLKWITDCITNFPEMNGTILLENFKSLIDEDRIHTNKEHLYGEYYFIHAFLQYNDIFRMMDDFKMSHSYFNDSSSKFAYPFMITSFGSFHMLFLYYNKNGRLSEIVDFIQDNLHYFIEISGGCHTGSQHLVLAEYAYDTGDYSNVVSNAKIAYQQAIESNQFSGAICCLFCLGRYMLMQKKNMNYQRVIEQLNHLYKEVDSPILHNQIDCSLAYLYILNDECDKIQIWLRDGEFEDVYLLPEANITAYLIHGMYLMKEKNTIELKELCDTITKKNQTQPFAYVDIYVHIFRLVCELETGNIKVALQQLHNVIELCQNDQIKSPIIELSFAFSLLIDKYTPSTDFEKELLQDMKLRLVSNCTVPTKKLTDKEIKILKLYASGKKTKEIADIKCISINTVQTHIKSIYSKLQISTKIEAAQYYKNNYSN